MTRSTRPEGAPSTPDTHPVRVMRRLDDGTMVRAVATDGHRLALCETAASAKSKNSQQVIVPRKGVLEMQRVLTEDGDAEIAIGTAFNDQCTSLTLCRALAAANNDWQTNMIWIRYWSCPIRPDRPRAGNCA